MFSVVLFFWENLEHCKVENFKKNFGQSNFTTSKDVKKCDQGNIWAHFKKIIVNCSHFGQVMAGNVGTIVQNC